MNPELRDRVVLPIAIPVGGLALIGILVFAFSRILLAVGKDVAVAVALAAALDVLVVCAILAYRPPSAATNRLAAVVGVGVLIAGGIAMTAGDVVEEAEGPVVGEGAPAPAEPRGLRLVAKDLKFDLPEITVPAGDEVVIELRNEDPQTPHNLSVYADRTLVETVHRGELFNGVNSRTERFPAPEPGSYHFQCDVHPTTMAGTFTVT